MTEIGFITTIWNTGSSYYRLELPQKCLEKQYTCHRFNDYIVSDSGELLGCTWLADGTQDVYDEVEVFVTQRWMNDNAVEITRRAQAVGQKIIADVDDHYWELPPDNIAYYGTSPDLIPEYNRDLYFEHLKVCDAIICSTPELYSYLEPLDVPIYLRRNMVDLDLWKTRNVASSKYHPTVGWTGSTRWRQSDLLEPQGAIGEFVNDNKLKFSFVGYRPDAPCAGDLFGIESKRVSRQPQCEFANYPFRFSRAKIDINLVPMVTSPFNRAKSCCHGLESSASGIPFIASALPEYEWLDAGLIAKSRNDWMAGLTKLLDPEFRLDLAGRGLERVQSEDFRVRGHEYLDLFSSLIN